MLLHGRGADEYDLIDLADHLPRSFTYASVRGYVALPEGGYTWFENRGVARPVAASVRASIATFRAWLDAALDAPNGTVYLLGFSAGMMMASAVLAADPERFGGAVLLSGALALGALPEATAGRLAGVPVFYGRGTRDDVIPAPLVDEADTYLCDRSGADVTFRTYDHAHTISPAEIKDIAAWFAERG